MKEGWVEKKLGDVCHYDKITDKNPNLKYIGLENIESNTGRYLKSEEEHQAISNTYHFTEKHVLYGRLRPYLNKVYLPDFEGRCSTEIFPIAVNDELTREYLFYWLTSEKIVKRINATWTGARMPRANMNEVLIFEIPLPPLSEQKEIVAILDELFVKLDKAKANLERNLENVEELYQRKLNDIFSNKETYWIVKKLNEVCDVRDGTHDSPAYVEQGYPLITSKNVTSGYLDLSNVNYISESDFQKISVRSAVDDGDIIMPMIGTIGKPLIIQKTFDFAIKNVALIKFTKSGEALNRFIYYLLSGDVFNQYVQKKNQGCTQKFISLGNIRNFEIPLPPLSEQKEIVAALDELKTKTDALKDIYKQKILGLEEMRKTVLEMAFRGELV